MELLVHLHKEAKELHNEEMQNKKNATNLILDSISAGTLGLQLLMDTSGCKILFCTFEHVLSFYNMLFLYMVVPCMWGAWTKHTAASGGAFLCDYYLRCTSFV